jgi:hypothetical protein
VNRFNNKSDLRKTPALVASEAALSTTPGSCGIAFMAKASSPGRAKTRLVPPLTFDEAAALNTAFLQDVADNVLSAAGHAAPNAGIAGYAAYGPTGTQDFFHRILPNVIGLIEASIHPPWCSMPTARLCLPRC